MRRSRGDEDMAPGKARIGRGERAVDGGGDRFGFGQATGAIFAAGHRAFVGFKHRDAVAAQLRDVARRGGMLPHPHVHRWSGDDGRVGRE